jgi:hypothetical protein
MPVFLVRPALRSVRDVQRRLQGSLRVGPSNAHDRWIYRNHRDRCLEQHTPR